MKRRTTCTCNRCACQTRWVAIILFLFTLPLLTFWLGFEVAKMHCIESQLITIDQDHAQCASRR